MISVNLYSNSSKELEKYEDTKANIEKISKHRKEKMEEWKNTKDFPMQSQMLKQLYEYGIVISDMKEKMKSFFNDIKNVIKKINKNFNSTKTLYLQGKPRIFWKIKKLTPPRHKQNVLKF